MNRVILTLLLLIAVSTCYDPDDDDSDVVIDSDFDGYNKLIDKLKQHEGSGFTRLNEDSCVIQCFRRVLPKEVEEHFLRQILSKKIVIHKFFKYNTLKKLCKYYNHTYDCLQDCPASFQKTTYLEYFQVFKFMCINTNFLDYVPCYTETLNRTWISCNTQETCRPKRNQVNRFLKNQTMEKKDVLKLFGDVCDYVNCFNDCQHATMVEKCGTEKIRIYNKFFRTISQFFKNYHTIFLTSEETLPFPFQCNRVGLQLED